MFKITFCIFSFIFFLPGAQAILAQDNELNFININRENGLSSNNVTAILKDRYGYLWFGTNDGLNKFDGKNFNVYRHSEEDPGSILSNEIRALYEDNKGNLWIGTGGGLTLYNRKLNTFNHYDKAYSETVISIGSSPSGRLWLGTYKGLLSFDHLSGNIVPVGLKSYRGKQAIAANVVTIFEDKKGRTWLATNQGVFLYVPREARFIHFFSSGKQHSLADNRVRCIAEDHTGNIWLGTENGLSMTEGARPGNFVNYRTVADDKTTISSNIIYSIASGEDGKLWLGTEKGITILNPATRHFQRLESDQDMFSFQGKAVKAILADYDNMYWIGMDKAGVFKYDKNLTFFNLRKNNTLNSDWAGGSVVTAFEEAENGQIYIGTDGGGISLFNLRSGEFNRNFSSALRGLKGKSILAMEKVGTELWIGTFLEGIFVFDTQTKKLRQINKNSKNYRLSGNDIFCLKQDRKGHVWIGTNGQGVNWFNIAEKKVYRFDHTAKDIPLPLKSGFIRSIEEDADGNLWIGTSGSGIIVYHPETGVHRTLNKANSGLPKDQVNTIYISLKGSVWVGMTEGGLAYYNKSTRRFRVFSGKNGLTNEVIFKILEDDKGKLWLSTNTGISTFDPLTRKFKNYAHYNGLQQGAFVLGAGMRSQDGTLLFGGEAGFNYLKPEKVTKSGFIPKVVFTDFKIAGKSVTPAETSEIKEHISTAREIEISYRQNFSISFTALNFTAPHDNRYLYRLEKYDKGWIDGGSTGTAVYTNLDPGAYVFHVKAISAAGDWVSTPASIRVYVRPPVWMTTYAYIIYFSMLGLGAWYMRKRAVKKLRAQFIAEQERRETERLHQFDQLKIKFLTNLSHEFRTPISLILGPIEQLLQVEPDPEKSDQLSMVRRNTRRLLNLVNQLLDFRNLEEKESKLRSRELDFISIARDVSESFRDLAERKQISFALHSELKYYFTSIDPDKIERVLFNLLSNAFKFTPKGGKVNFHVSRDSEGQGLLIRIADNGPGIKEAEKEKIFTRFYQINDDSTVNKGSGIGLSIAREFVKLHGGTICVEGNTERGASFIIRLPCIEIQHQVELPEEEDFHSPPQLPAEVQRPAILIVEDDEDFRYYLKQNLQTSYRVIEASNGKEGWQKALSSHPLLVVCDITMPYINGTDLCKKIKSDKRTSHIPVLLITALSGEEEQLFGLETGASDYLTKPFSFNILNVKIRNLLTLNEQLRSTYSKQIQVNSPEINITSENETLLGKIVEYIDANLNNASLSVQDLSNYVGMSRGSLYLKILELSGKTPIEFIRSMKLKRAAVLLQDSEMNVAQVGYAVGFSSPSYFTQAFKAYYNMAPSEYVQLNRKKRKCL